MLNNAISLSLVTHHLNGHHKVEALLQELRKLDEQVRAQFEIIIVDDCSDSSIIPQFNGLNLKAYRVTDDIPWNQSGARNLGCLMAESPWVLFFDIDQVPLEDSVSLILKSIKDLEYNCLYYFYVKDFIDSNLKKKLDIHPNTFLANTQRFKTTGMYDEDFAGHYGYEDLYLPYVWEFYGGKRLILGNTPLFIDTKFKTEKLDRSGVINEALALKKINAGLKKPSSFIRFSWEHQISIIYK
jgi:glycosyltransferase involved in cell wall biosynthesis